MCDTIDIDRLKIQPLDTLYSLYTIQPERIITISPFYFFFKLKNTLYENKKIKKNKKCYLYSDLDLKITLMITTIKIKCNNGLILFPLE
jgi:hypothetical protein